MSADGDFIRTCRWEAEALLAAVENSQETFHDLPNLFEQAAITVRDADNERVRWLEGRPLSEGGRQ
jgi:hypothetical protein